MGRSVLRVSVPDDSDGVLRLALQWRGQWNGMSGRRSCCRRSGFVVAAELDSVGD